jgi:hypothetical protein
MDDLHGDPRSVLGSARPARRLALVPRQPGPLRPLDARSGKAGDDLDALIDEVFGPPTDEGPGILDAALVAAGLALLGASLLANAGGAAAVVGLCLLVLGVALPARASIQAGRSRRTARQERQAIGSGLALDLADPSLNTLAASYEELRTAAGLPGVPVGREAVEAGHAALLEVASLLGGRTPETDEERVYVNRRTAAIRDLTAAMARQYHDWRQDHLAVEPPAAETAAVVRARDELEAVTGTGAVTELKRLRADLAGEARRDDG